MILETSQGTTLSGFSEVRKVLKITSKIPLHLHKSHKKCKFREKI